MQLQLALVLYFTACSPFPLQSWTPTLGQVLRESWCLEDGTGGGSGLRAQSQSRLRP